MDTCEYRIGQNVLALQTRHLRFHQVNTRFFLHVGFFLLVRGSGVSLFTAICLNPYFHIGQSSCLLFLKSMDLFSMVQTSWEVSCDSKTGFHSIRIGPAWSQLGWNQIDRPDPPNFRFQKDIFMLRTDVQCGGSWLLFNFSVCFCFCFVFTDYYERDAPTSGRAGRTKPASLKPLQLAYYQVNFYAAKVRRQREYSLHRKCCVNGCTRYDFAGVCWARPRPRPRPRLLRSRRHEIHIGDTADARFLLASFRRLLRGFATGLHCE